MQINLISVGTKMPLWVQQGVEQYSRRFPADFQLKLKQVPLVKRSKSVNVDQCVKKEAAGILSQLKSGDYVVAMDVIGKSMDTLELARRIDAIRLQGQDLSLLVGGPDGLGQECLARAREKWSLSALTLPHPLVRILLAEQLYRVWTVLNGHPYHRE